MSAGPDPAPGELAGDGAWLELAVTCDPEAVEAVGEILARAAPGGVSVEPGFTLVDEGLGAAIDPAAPATVRAYLPARDAGAARRAAGEVDRALGHLGAFGLREIGELRTQVVHESDWAAAWKRHVGVLRIGRRIVIRPTWRRYRRRPGDVVIAMDPGMAFGTGLHPTTRLCLAGIERWADEGLLVGGPAGRPAAPRERTRAPLARQADPLPAPPGSSTWAADRECSRSPPGCWAPARSSASTPTRSPWRRRSPTRGATGSPVGSGRGRARCRPGAGPFDLVVANLIASVLVARAADLAAELRPGGRLLASGIFVDREAARAGGLRGRGPPRPPARCRGRLGGPGGRPTGRVGGRARLSRSRSGRG